jgi:feruloyl esterase
MTRTTRLIVGLTWLSLTFAAATGRAVGRDVSPLEVPNLENFCRAETMQTVASALKSTVVTVQPVPDGPFKGATRYVAATASVPAFCQVTGSFVTNSITGKTANFLATFPATWNNKYLQLGCSGLCGQFYVSDPSTPAITVTAQGYPGQIISKGYAVFSTDEGHVGMSADWAVKGSGQVDEDAITDLYYRADKVLAQMGKEFATAFYAGMSSSPRKITRAYFSGCSGGGHDAFVAVAHFPEEFDGIIAGAPANYVGLPFALSGIAAAMARTPDAKISPALAALIDPIVKKQCDALDGVKDGLIQNPAACNFRPDRDLPRCEDDEPGAQCFTTAQINTVSTVISAVTDEHGNVVQPGFTVSELQTAVGAAALADTMLKFFVHKNDPTFTTSSLFTFGEGKNGQVTAFHTIVAASEVAKAKEAMWMGTGEFPETTAKLIKLDRKFLIWNNFSDQTLIPFTAVNYYKQLAKLNGGYAKVQKNVRLFMLPGTDHCSITGIGPNSFDPLTAMENWVEKGTAPDGLKASVADHQFSPGAPKAAALKTPNWTMPLCKFPEMARYSGKGDIKDASNWRCPANDTRMLKVGESGRQAGVVE